MRVIEYIAVKVMIPDKIGAILSFVCKSAVIEDWKKEREVAKYRYRVLCFYDKHGLDATQNF